VPNGPSRRRAPGHHVGTPLGHARRAPLERDYVDDRVSDVIEMLFGKVTPTWPLRRRPPLAVAPGAASTTRADDQHHLGHRRRALGLVRPMSGSCPSGSSGRSAWTRRAPRSTTRTWIASSFVHATARTSPGSPALPARRHLRRRATPLGRLGGRCPCGALGRRERPQPVLAAMVGHRRRYGTFRAAGFEARPSCSARARPHRRALRQDPDERSAELVAGGPRSWPRWRRR